MVWVQCGPRLNNPKFGDLITSKKIKVPVSRYLAPKQPKLRRFDLDHNIQLVVGDQKEGRSNACVVSVMKHDAKFYWKGPIVVLADKSDEYADEHEAVIYKDVTTSDFRVVVDFFKRYDDHEKDTQILEKKSDLQSSKRNCAPSS